MHRSSRLSDDQQLILYYRNRTGIQDPYMPDVADFAEEIGYTKMPKPKTAKALLAKRLSRAARLSSREDEETGLFGRSNLAYPVVEEGEIRIRWFDPQSATATEDKFDKSRTLRRDQMVGDAFQYAVDDILWNRYHPDGRQFELDLNLTEDVMWRLKGIEAQRNKKKKAG